MASDKGPEKPFHEAIVEIMEMTTNPEAMEIVAMSLMMTKIPDEHRPVVMTIFWERVKTLGIEERIRGFLADRKAERRKISESPVPSA